MIPWQSNGTVWHHTSITPHWTKQWDLCQDSSHLNGSFINFHQIDWNNVKNMKTLIQVYARSHNSVRWYRTCVIKWILFMYGIWPQNAFNWYCWIIIARSLTHWLQSIAFHSQIPCTWRFVLYLLYVFKWTDNPPKKVITIISGVSSQVHTEPLFKM